METPESVYTGVLMEKIIKLPRPGTEEERVYWRSIDELKRRGVLNTDEGYAALHPSGLLLNPRDRDGSPLLVTDLGWMLEYLFEKYGEAPNGDFRFKVDIVYIEKKAVI